MAIKNPLRYPGAKSKLYNYIYKLLVFENKLNCTFYEPFAGSASISLLLLENKAVKRAVLNELDPLLYYFWYSVFNHTDELIKMISDTEISLENWHKLSHYRNSDYLAHKTPVEIGFAGLFLNRTNFSGILKANPLGGLQQKSRYTIDCRFNKIRIIESIRQLSIFRDRIDLFNMDAIDFMKQELKYKRNKSIFVYIDPPYYKEGSNLYRCYYTPEQHKDLAKYLLPKSFPWLISYDDAPEILNLYRQNSPLTIHMDYSVHTSRKAEELLISNLEIPPVEDAVSYIIS
nr:MAG TPA: DNA adenine methylase [Bacteriophage sp.]